VTAQPSSRGAGPAKTLGDLLYGDRAVSPVAESEWVGMVRAIALGDQGAFRTVYERTHRIVFTLMFRITHSHATAEELTVDVFHEVWRRASQYDAANGTVIGWIMNQARSRAIDRVRFEQRKKRVNPSPDQPVPVALERDPAAAVELEEASRRLRDALTTLTPDERRAIETAFFSELTYDEAARRLNQPLGTVKTRIRSGLEKLRRVLGATARAS